MRIGGTAHDVLMTLIPIAVALVVEYTAVILVLLYARLRGKKVGPALWYAGILAIAGCFFASGAYDAALRRWIPAPPGDVSADGRFGPPLDADECRVDIRPREEHRRRDDADEGSGRPIRHLHADRPVGIGAG